MYRFNLSHNAKLKYVYPVFELLGGGLGGLNPPSYFLDPPNAVSDFVLGGQYIQHTYDLHRSLESLYDSRKKLNPPQLFFHNSNPVSIRPSNTAQDNVSCSQCMFWDARMHRRMHG